MRRIGEQIAMVVGKKPGTCTVTATINNAEPACTVTVTPSTLPDGWSYHEPSTPPTPGAVLVAEGTFTVTGCGHAIYTNTEWDEAGRDAGVYRHGKCLAKWISREPFP